MGFSSDRRISMEEFSIRDFLKAVEFLKHGDTQYAELSAWIRRIRASVETECLNGRLYGKAGPCCPEWPYVCSECRRNVERYYPDPAKPEGTTVADFIRELDRLAERKHITDLSEYLAKIRMRVAPECLE